MDSLQTIQDYTQSNLNFALKNPYLMAFLKITLVLYAARIAPQPPTFIQDSFQYTFVKIIAIALLAYLADVDFQLSVLMAIALVLGANLLSGRGIFESYDNMQDDMAVSQVGEHHSDMTKYTTLLGTPAEIGKQTLIESHSDNYPGCMSVTMADLLNVFDGDALKLQKTLQYAFHELNASLPEGDAKENLTRIARAAGLPYNVELNDTNAPFIATILLNYGYKISEQCQQPQ